MSRLKKYFNDDPDNQLSYDARGLVTYESYQKAHRHYFMKSLSAEDRENLRFMSELLNRNKK